MNRHYRASSSCHLRLRVTALCVVLATPLSAQAPRAIPNDNRTSAGRMVNGELRISLDAMIAEWRPRGESGPVKRALTFTESGRAPSVPGPMIRLAAGTPVRIAIRNTLAQPMRIRGLGDRDVASRPGASSVRPFLAATSMTLQPGETREVRFTPTRATTSFYRANLVTPAAEFDGSGFEGAYIVDPTGESPPPGERVMMITTSGDEGGPSVKLSVNGLSWPYTERLSYAFGDTVRWRLIVSSSAVVHPMHLHGFYFNVDASGDGDVDTVYAPGDRPREVTHRMEGTSTLRMSWVATEPGNWLFHCHLIRHMGEVQRYAVERATEKANAGRSTRSAAEHEHPEHEMAGLVMGITVRPPSGVARAEPAPARRIDLWTGTRPGAYKDGPELGFVIQHDAVPAADSTRVPGGTIELHEGEPTRIVVHNRLTFPLSLHWHGLELKSAYDGVGAWSGDPASPRMPIAPGDSRALLITPRRAGTFMYHTHGEAHYELAQGLYGGFLVLKRGETRDPVHDRLFMLASRGAVINSPPAINGLAQAPTEHFVPGQTTRLRFAHISVDELKTIRLLRDGKEVSWRLVAKDGADLPATQRVEVVASFDLGVGETRDVEWTPPSPGVYVLEVRTRYYPQRGGAEIQRVPFAVGSVSNAAITAAILGTDLPVVAVDAASLASYVGVYGGSETASVPSPSLLYVEQGRLFVVGRTARDTVPKARLLFPLGGESFAFGTFEDGVIKKVDTDHRARFVRTDGRISALEVTDSAAPAIRLPRDADVVLSTAELDRLVGSWSPPGAAFSLRIERAGNALTLMPPNGVRYSLLALSSTRFVAPSLQPGFELRVVLDGDRVAALEFEFPGQPPQRIVRTP